jgi:hypothetical protein
MSRAAHVRQEALDEQLSDLLNKYALPDSWATAAQQNAG